jgi:nucleotide-binding universal stress UspA family protein
MNKVVVAYDGSEQAADALALGARIAKAEGGELHLASVVFDGNPKTEQDRFESLFAQAREALGDGGFEQHPLRDVDAADALGTLAGEIEPDLLVLGSTHRGRLGQIMLGGVGERLLNSAPCPVAIAPRGYAGRDHFGAGVIGVGYDDSAESALALDAAVRLARVVGGTVRLIAVFQHDIVPGEIGGAETGDRRPSRERLQAMLAAAAEGVEGVEVEAVIEEGDVVDELAGQAVELDLLVVGSRGYGPVRRVLLGGVSTALTRVCPCPLLVTPRSSEAGEQRAAEA